MPSATAQRPRPSAAARKVSAPSPWRKRTQLGAVAVIAIAVVALVWLAGSDPKNVATTVPSTTAKAATAAAPSGPQTAGAGATTATASAGTPAADAAVAAAGGSARPIPAAVTFSGNENLRDGSVVTIHVAADAGSQVFGFEGYLCKAGVDYADDADIRPSRTGNCAGHPLSSASDKVIGVRGAPPYESLDGSFRVGVGSDTYDMADGTQGSISCGPANPCVIVLKIQYPGDYGFRVIPLSYA